MASAINRTDLCLVAGDAEPRISDLRLAERLEFERPNKIRELIERNRDELESYASLPRHGVNPTSLGGRPSTGYWLTKSQAILICMWSGAPKAADARSELIAVYLAYEQGQLSPIGDLPTITGAIRDLFTPVIDQFNQLNQRVERIDSNVVYLKSLKDRDRKDPTLGTKRSFLEVIQHHYRGICPCLECNIKIADQNGFLPKVCTFHHQFNRWNNKPEAMIPLAQPCHIRVETNDEARNRLGHLAFPQFQNLLTRMPNGQLTLRFPNEE